MLKRKQSPSKPRNPKKQKKNDSGDNQTVINGDYELFYGKKCVFSQFHPCTFIVDGVEYNCMEQYMHHQKAVLFGDEEFAKKILDEKLPLEQKKLGRKVRNFDPKVWGRKSTEIVKQGNIAKFKQNEELKEKLFATHPRTLAEASPRDRLWGIGMGKNNENAGDKSKWRGKNLLGFALTDVRETLMNDEKDVNK